MKTTLIITSGIPCAGKSTWSSQMFYPIVSRDNIRESYFIKPYKYSNANEVLVSKWFFQKLDRLIFLDFKNIILDNTFCKESYIDDIIKKYPECNIQIKYFDIPLWKAHYRNVIRYLKTGKRIPIKVMNDMYKNYNKINKSKYAKYNI